MMVTPWASILCYHGVTSASLPAAGTMHVPEGELLAAIDTIRSIAEIVPLALLVDRLRAGRSIRGLVALSFDDGYASLIPLVAGSLAPSATPITVFVTTAASDAGARFWWDRVEDLFPQVASSRWRAFEDLIGVPQAYRDGQPADYGPLRPLRQWIMAAHRGRWPAHLEEPLVALESECGLTTPHRAMTWDEISRLVATGVVDVGVHTISHPVLPLLSDDDVTREVAGSYQKIRETLGPRALPILAIPFGLYDERTVPLASRAGMTTSLTLANRSMRGVRADAAAVPRLSMGKGLRRWKLVLRLVLPRALPSDYPALPSATT